MNQIIVNGLLITTRRKYVQFISSNQFRLINDTKCNLLKILFPRGAYSGQLRCSQLELIDDVRLYDTDVILTKNVPITINGTSIMKLVPHEYTFSQYLVRGLQDFIMDYDHERCIILVPDTKTTYYTDYMNLLNKNPYIKILAYNDQIKLSNIMSILIKYQGGSIYSDQLMVFNPKESYEKYLLKDIDIINSFLDQLKSILLNYGVQLVRYPIDQNSVTTNRIIYKITELGKLESHKSGYEIDNDSVLHKTTIEFECSFADQVLLNDFRSRYSNIDLVSDFTTFYTIDKANRPWLSSVHWTPIDFNHNSDYSSDSQGNIAHMCNFSCEIEYYVVYDKLYNRIQHIITKLIEESKPSSPAKQFDDWMELRR